MGLFLVLWFVLMATTLVASAVVAWGVVRHVDLRFEAFALMVLVPTVQAAVLTWRLRARVAAGAPPSALTPTLGRALAAAIRHPFATPVIALGLIVLGLGWFRPLHPLFTIHGGRLPLTWLGTQLLAAAIAMVAIAARRPIDTNAAGRPAHDVHTRAPEASTHAARLTLATLAVCLAIAGLQAWMRQPFDLTAILMPAMPRVIRWIIIYGALAAAAATLLIRGGRELATRDPNAAALVDLAIAAAFAALVVVILSYFLRPFLIAPWSGVVWSFLSIAASALLIATLMSVMTMRPAQPAGSARRAQPTRPARPSKAGAR